MDRVELPNGYAPACADAVGVPGGYHVDRKQRRAVTRATNVYMEKIGPGLYLPTAAAGPDVQERRRLVAGVLAVLVALAAAARLVAGAGVRVAELARAGRSRERRPVARVTGGPTRGPGAVARSGRSGVLPMTT